MKRRVPQSPSNGPDLSITLPPVDYSEESLELIQQMVYRFPNCAGCPTKISEPPISEIPN